MRPANPPPEGMIAIALGDDRVLFVHSIAAGVPAALTRAEREVVRLALDGLDNAGIARARSVATRTVANLLARAYRKLGVSSRSELAAAIFDPDVVVPPK